MSKDGWIKDLKMFSRFVCFKLRHIVRVSAQCRIFQCHKTNSWWSIFVFNVFKQSPKKSYAKYGKCTDLQTYFSEKNIWRGSEVFQGITVPKFRWNRFVLSNVKECDSLSSIRYRNIPAFHISEEDLIFRQRF